MTDIFKAIADGMKITHTAMPLAAIWLKAPLVTGEGKTRRIAPDATLCIHNGEIVDCSEDMKPTHRIILCYGTMYNQFEITAVSLTDGQPIIIKL